MSATGKRHLSVVYFHGMGSQRRFEETSRLIDRLDRFFEVAFRQGRKLGKLRLIKPRAEKNADPDKEDVTYIAATRLEEPRKGGGHETDLHFYEAYWADEMAEVRSTWAVIKWIVRQVWRPLATLRTPWRERQRLRRAFLIELSETESAWPGTTRRKDFQDLLELYRNFDHHNWLREEQERRAKGEDLSGDFDGFVKFIAARNDGKPDRIARLTALANLWHKRYVRHELASFGAMLSLLLAILLVILAVALGVINVLALLPAVTSQLGLTDFTPPDWAQPTLANSVSIAFGIILALGLRGFLVNRMADVEAWSTYSETDEKFRKREAVLTKSVDLLMHVLNDPDCERVVVVAHSLGTSVAYDTLLAAVHANRAVNASNPMTGQANLEKISHFVTLASPVDKISYFFESFRSPVRRYRKVYDALRGDIGTPPFSKTGGQPHVHWINIWDQQDIISGPLQSPAAARGLQARVDNVHVNSLNYLNPGAAHNGYFDNAAVISMLFDVIFENRGNYDSKNLKPYFDEQGRRDGLDYRGVDFGPGDGYGTWVRTLLAGSLAPWAWLVYVVTQFYGLLALSGAALVLAVLLTAVPAFGAARGLIRKNRLADPLE